ncbi:hypothetical protein NDU88_009731 [Pleurodeles waltl]|uniref:Uncharacterized protein n=1 Tax=Pleurodeles waltl TaxID=8319 RepID=A0AAV7QVD6_PLEWA|nr:hypothetical protein NDU88_009731 [Pleurodeles waltl]
MRTRHVGNALKVATHAAFGVRALKILLRQRWREGCPSGGLEASEEWGGGCTDSARAATEGVRTMLRRNKADKEVPSRNASSLETTLLAMHQSLQMIDSKINKLDLCMDHFSAKLKQRVERLTEAE